MTANADRFEFPHHPDLAYQWVTLSVLGDRRFDQTAEMAAGGWERVPRAKLPDVESEDVDYIILRGLVLMQRPREVDDAARAKVLAASLKMVETCIEQYQYDGKVSKTFRMGQLGVVFPRHPVISKPDRLSIFFVPRGTFRFRILTVLRALRCWWFGLTDRQITAAIDGTIVHNRDDPNGRFQNGEAIGIREYARRFRLMKDKT